MCVHGTHVCSLLSTLKAGFHLSDPFMSDKKRREGLLKTAGLKEALAEKVQEESESFKCFDSLHPAS